MMDESEDFQIPEFGDWYTLEADKPSAALQGRLGGKRNLFEAEYYQNDQTFINLSYNAPANNDAGTFLKGSYLWDNGWFGGLGLGLLPFGGGDTTQLTLSPGYRYNFPGNAGYLAASLDLSATEDYYSNAGLIDLEVAARYATQQSRVYGQVILPNKDVVMYEDIYYHCGGVVRTAKNIVCGADLLSINGQTRYHLGFSSAINQYGFEARYVRGDGGSWIDLNLLYALNPNCRAGLAIKKQDNISDPYLTAKLKYTFDPQNSLVVMHQLKNTSAPDLEAITYLRWDITLK